MSSLLGQMFYHLTVYSLITNIQINDVSIADSDSINFVFEAFGVEHDITLQKNNFLSDNFTAFEYSSSSIQTVAIENCYYISDMAAFSYCDKLDGLFFSKELNETISVKPIDNKQYNITRNVTFDLGNGWCPDSLPLNLKVDKNLLLKKRALTSALIEILAVADISMYKKYVATTAQHILDVFNYAASIYSQNSNTFAVPITLQLNSVIIFKEPMLTRYDTTSVLSSVHEFYNDLSTKTIFPSAKYDYIRNVDHVTLYMTPSFVEYGVIGYLSLI
eukprot:NODE_123_length_17687_cov_0.732261.p7 type:complete len:275 gc:universal NODE_123_length_17687_cov_0.732261:5537-6361(+)